MRSSVLDKVVRVVILVLAGLVSLSIIGAIGAMSQGGGRGGFVFDTRPAAAPPQDEVEAERQAAPETGIRRAGTPREPGAAVAAPAAGAEAGSARWLEVIAYVLFAIAGLAALLVLVLWRASADLRRAADALAGRAG